MKKRLKILGCSLLLILSLVWVALSPRFSPGLYSDALFKPYWGKGSQQELTQFKDFENHELYFTGNSGQSLHGWVFINPQAKKIVLFHHGNAGDIPKRLPLIRYLLESGASVFIYEPRGFGLSAGQPSIKSICEDGESAYDYLIKSGYEPSQIVIYGESLGAAVATHVASVRESAGIILQSPFASLEKIAKEQVPIVRMYPSFLFPVPALNNMELMSAAHPPLLIMHGERDTLIGIHHSQALFDAACGPKQFVRFPHSGHSDVQGSDLQLYLRTVSGFLASLP